MKRNLALAICLWSACLFAQDGLRRDPQELVGVLGQMTITDTVRELRLPDKAELLGVFDWDRDGRAEIFAGWTREAPGSKPRETFENHLLLLREEPGGRTRVEKEYIIREDSRLTHIEFFAPPDRRDTVKMAVNILGGAYWAKVYLLESGFDHPANVKARSGREGATDFEFIDLNNDGVYEAVAWDRRPEDLRCHFGMFGGRLLPAILVRDRMEYRLVWPSKEAGWHEVMTSFTDLDDDGTAEIVSLEDNKTDRAGAQRLAVYKMEGTIFRRIAKASVPWPQIAYFFDVTKRGWIDLHIASQEKCKEGGIPAGKDTDTISYEFRNGALQRLPSEPRKVITLKSPPLEFVSCFIGLQPLGKKEGESPLLKIAFSISRMLFSAREIQLPFHRRRTP